MNSFYQPKHGRFTKEACMKRLEELFLGRLQAIPVDKKGGMLTFMLTHQVAVLAVIRVHTSSGDIRAYATKISETKRLEL